MCCIHLWERGVPTDPSRRAVRNAAANCHNICVTAQPAERGDETPRGPWTRLSHATADKTALHQKQAALIAPDRSRAGSRHDPRRRGTKRKRQHGTERRNQEKGSLGTKKKTWTYERFLLVVVDVSPGLDEAQRHLEYLGAAETTVRQNLKLQETFGCASLLFMNLAPNGKVWTVSLHWSHVTKERCLLNWAVTYWQNIHGKITLSCIVCE